MIKKLWTADERKIIIDNYETMSYQKIGEILGRTANSVMLMSYQLGLSRNQKTPEQKQPKYGWRQHRPASISAAFSQEHKDKIDRLKTERGTYGNPKGGKHEI